MHTRDDLDLESDVLRKLRADGRIDAQGVKVEVEENKLILKGSVPSFYEKLIAEDYAVEVTELENVRNDLEVAYPESANPPVERTIQDRVKQNLQHDPALKADQINVRSEGSDVILEGSVRSVENKRQAENDAGAVRGVTHVLNNLAIVPFPNRKDELIGVEIMKLLASRDLVEGQNIDIIVEDGKVTLQGTVPNWSLKSAVNKVARYPLGVFEVLDNLNITHEGEERVTK